MLEQREGGCHCGRVRFRARVDLDLLSQCNCTVCTKKGILHLPVVLENFELLRGKNSLTTYTFGTGVAQHTFCSHCGMHAFYVPRSQPDGITVNARCLDDIDGPSLKPTRFFDGRHWEEAQRKTDCRRRTYRRCRIERGSHTKENSGPRSGIRCRMRRTIAVGFPNPQEIPSPIYRAGRGWGRHDVKRRAALGQRRRCHRPLLTAAALTSAGDTRWSTAALTLTPPAIAA